MTMTDDNFKIYLSSGVNVLDLESCNVSVMPQAQWHNRVPPIGVEAPLMNNQHAVPLSYERFVGKNQTSHAYTREIHYLVRSHSKYPSLRHSDSSSMGRPQVTTTRQNQVDDQRFSLKKLFAESAHSCGPRKPCSCHSYSTFFSRMQDMCHTDTQFALTKG